MCSLQLACHHLPIPLCFTRSPELIPGSCPMQSTAQNYNSVSSALIAVGSGGLSSLHVFSRVVLGLSKNLVLCGPASVTHGNRKQGWCKQKSLDTHSGLVCSGALCFLGVPRMHLLLCKAKSVIITKTCFLLISYSCA